MVARTSVNMSSHFRIQYKRYADEHVSVFFVLLLCGSELLSIEIECFPSLSLTEIYLIPLFIITVAGQYLEGDLEMKQPLGSCRAGEC